MFCLVWWVMVWVSCNVVVVGVFFGCMKLVKGGVVFW